MSSTCTITFDNNPLGVYYAGQVVSGSAELITTRPKTIRSITIIVSGYAEVRWTENITKPDSEGKPQKAIETYSGSEVYYSYETCVYGQSAGAQLELPAGKYVFPFQTTIPPTAPTSFNGATGHIQHEVTVAVDRVMRYDNTFKQPFTVISPYDLNLNPENAKPLHKIDEKTFCWSLCCGTKGPMVMTVNAPFSAYAPGQKIRFHIVLDNQSDIHCSDVKVRLMKHVTYTSRSPEQKTEKLDVKVADNHCGEVVKLNKAEFNEFLQIPSTTPTSLESCSLIKVSYTLKFIAKTNRLHGDLVIEFPLVIGTVPLYASAGDPGPITSQPTGSGPVYKPLPPPSYEEDVRSQQFDNSNTFKPRYPVFLSDGSAPQNGGGIVAPDPSKANSLYPSPSIAPPSPRPSQPYPPPSVPSVPSPTPIPMGSNVAPYPPSPGPSPSPLPQPCVPAAKPKPPKDPSFEVLGFSIPPDYEPTPSAPAEEGIGWRKA